MSVIRPIVFKSNEQLLEQAVRDFYINKNKLARETLCRDMSAKTWDSVQPLAVSGRA